MKVTKRHLTGREHLSAITDLLQRIRVEGAYEGLYEAADLQWWWRYDDVAMVQTELVDAPAQRPLALEFRVKSRVDDEMPHHLIKRNGNAVERKLSECSLYRPELDLSIDRRGHKPPS
jgi:hypothetical protein